MQSETEGQGSFETLGCDFGNWAPGTIDFERLLPMRSLSYMQSVCAFSFSHPWMAVRQVTYKGVPSVWHTATEPRSSRYLSGGVTKEWHRDRNTLIPWLFPSFPSDKETSCLVNRFESLELIFTNELMCWLTTGSCRPVSYSFLILSKTKGEGTEPMRLRGTVSTYEKTEYINLQKCIVKRQKLLFNPNPINSALMRYWSITGRGMWAWKVSTVYKLSRQGFQDSHFVVISEINMRCVFVGVSPASSTLPFGGLLPDRLFCSGLTHHQQVWHRSCSVSGYRLSLVPPCCPSCSTQQLCSLSASHVADKLHSVLWCWSDKQSWDLGECWPWQILVLCGNKWLCAYRLLSRMSVVLQVIRNNPKMWKMFPDPQEVRMKNKNTLRGISYKYLGQMTFLLSSPNCKNIRA